MNYGTNMSGCVNLNYDKLVRDRIPEIINSTGKKCKYVYCKDKFELRRRLVDKLNEEGQEYLEEYSDEELADLLQIVYSLIDSNGSKLEHITDIMNKKVNDRGGFKKGIILKEVH